MMRKVPPTMWRIRLIYSCLCFLFVLLNFSSAHAETRSSLKKSSTANSKKTEITVSGKVSDANGQAIPGASIQIQNTKIGVATDQDGNYSIKVQDTATLVYSAIGYATQRIKVGGRTTIDVIMTSDEKAVDEVVIVAFGKQKRTEVVGAVTSVKPADLKVPSSNLTSALAGRVGGVVAYQRSGEPGADNAEFFIRGVTTFGYKVSPLILIDNVEVTTTDLARLQIDDIASFSIMKDATSTALYGARGANGVILITTKEGKEGKANLNLRIENSISQPTQNLEFADPITYMRLHNEAILTRDPLGATIYSNQKIDNTIANLNQYAYPATDWQDMLLKNYTMNQRANLSISGGGKIARYYVSGTFNQDNGILKVDEKSNFNSNADLKTYSLRSNVNINVTNTTELIARLSGSFDDYTGPIDGGEAVYRQIMRTSPTLFPAYFPADEAHQFVDHILFGNFGTGNYLNPYANLQKGYKDYSRSKIDAQFQVIQQLPFITEGLSARAMINTSRYSYFDVQRAYNPFYYVLGSYDRTTNTPYYGIVNEELGTEFLNYVEGPKEVSSVLYGEAAVNYSRIFKAKHSVSGMLVGIMRSSLVGNAGDLQASLPFRNLGLSGRGTYTYDNRYSAEFNFGYNGSERFYESDRFGFFPSAGIAWTLSNEKFMKPLSKFFTELKLRATYGLVGNDEIGNVNDRFFYLSNVNLNDPAYRASFGQDNNYFRNGVSLSRYSNFDITWERAKKLNVGIQANLFNKLSIEADYFTEQRDNILSNRASIPNSMGLYAPIRANVGKASSSGVDANISYNQNFSNSFWMRGMATFTYATSQYKVVEEATMEPYQSKVGQSIRQVYGYIAERLFVDDEEVANSPRQNFGPVKGGDIKYKDINGDFQITTLDMVPIGHPTTPELQYGFGLSSGYKGLDFSFFFQGSALSSFWIDPRSTSPFANYNYSGETGAIVNQQKYNQLIKAYADNYWSEDNRNLYALWPRLDSRVNENNAQVSTWFMRNGAFLRLKQVEVGFTLPERWVKKAQISKARLYVNGTNLFSLSGFDLWDIEMAGSGLAYPTQRVFNGGIQLSF